MPAALLPAPPTPTTIRAERLRRDLHAFVKAAWPVLEPGAEYRDGPHLELLSRALADLFDAWHTGDPDHLAARDLVVNVPPGHMKSLLCRVFFPAWAWITRPDCRFLHGSHSLQLAVRDNVKLRRLVTSTWYQQRWPLGLLADQNAKLRFENEATGSSSVVSVGGGTGERFDIGLLDDPHDIDDRHSPAKLQSARDWVKDTWGSRKSDPRRSRAVLIMQRVHEDDATALLLDVSTPAPRHICLPAAFESDHPHRCVDDWRTEDGEPLWPAMYPADLVAADQRRYGSIAAAGLLQQRPTPAGGALFQDAWWRHHDGAPASADQWVASWDMTFKDTKTADFVVGQVWCARGADYYLVDQVRGRMDFVKARDAVTRLHERYPHVAAILVEESANGPAIISSLRRAVPGLIAVPARGSKEARAAAVSPLVEAGNVHLPDPRTSPWVDDFTAEARAFPLGKNDDQVDAMSQALARLQRDTVHYVRSVR